MRTTSPKTRRIKFWIHLANAYIRRYKLSIFIGIATIFATVFLFIKLSSSLARTNIVSVGYAGSYTLETVPTEILNLATQSLISIDQKGGPQPSLASHWTVSEDGKNYIVFLKDNLAWHDGSRLDAKDITLAIENVQITALNNKAIEFKLPNPISSFILALDKPVFKNKTFYGTGEFRITQISKTGDKIQKIGLTPKDKNLPKVEIKFYQTEDQLTNAVKMGDVKYASVVQAKEFEKWPNLKVNKVAAQDEIVAIFFNTQDSTLGSKEFRQALSHAINKTSFDGEPATSPISPNNWAYNPDVKRYDYNVGKAKELLSKSQIQNPQIKLTVVGGFENIPKSVKQDWEDLGIKVTVEESKTVPKDFQALLIVDKIPKDPDQYGLWHSSQTKTNLTKLNDPKIDKLLEDGRVIRNQDERKAVYQDFQRFLMEEAPIALLYRPYKYQVTYKNIEDQVKKLSMQQFQ